MVKRELYNFGFLQDVIPSEVRDALWKEIRTIQQDFSKATPRNKFLAGHMKHEYLLIESASILEKYILDMALAYDNQFHYFSEIDVLTSAVPMVMKNPWVNFQSKHEFNPLHNHKGILSFVIWLQIPYDLKEEFAQGPGKFNNPEENRTSIFEFVYVSALGQVANQAINVDKNYENNIIIFPAKMMHSVYPFYTSDDYRISVSGNIMLDTSK
jgi:hypothetical protein